MNGKKNQRPVFITIFGAKRDLTRRKLVPALYSFYTGNHLLGWCDGSAFGAKGREIVQLFPEVILR